MSRSLPEKVAGLYYAHGLFCSSHPIAVLTSAISVIILCCFPLVNLPMPGNAPRVVINNTAESTNSTESSSLYVQQIVLRAGVIPWSEDLKLLDAFRGPLHELFNLLEIIQNYQDPETSKSLSQACLHVEGLKRRNTKKPDVLPEYNCLVLSPANIWQQSMEMFSQDPNIIGTIFSYQSLQKGKISLAEILFGMNLKETGVKRYPIRVRQRIIQYAVTVFFKEHDPRLVKGLKNRLAMFYPLHQSTQNDSSATSDDKTLHIFYPNEFNYSELFPLTMTFFALFFYIYFSVRKIELVKSKVLVAFCASVTVMASLSMTVGVCFFFGLTLSHSGKEIFPYLVIIVGLENVLVLTKSVVSTQAHLDVKIRVAQGLSKEGWSITKNLLTEVTILTIGLFTFVPAIQEFCIFAIVGLFNDFFLQMVFFSTILSMDIRKTELSGDNKKFLHLPNVPTQRKQQFGSVVNKKSNIHRSKSHPRLNGLSGPTNVVAPTTQNTPTLVKIPKRLRLVHFWARTRIFQRAFMVWMIVWISMIIYNSGIIEQFVHLGNTLKVDDLDGYGIDRPKLVEYGKNMEKSTMKPVLKSPTIISPNHFNDQHSMTDNLTEELNKLKPLDFPPWNRLSLYHWSYVLSMYNISAAGEHITVLPTIKLSHVVGPQLVRQISNPNDVQQFQWQSLATAALDPLDFSDMGTMRSESRSFNTDAPFVPSSPMEIFLAAVLCLISVIVVVYTMVVLYRCICSRNYAEWRASWHQQEKSQDSVTQFMFEALPLVLEGHTQEVECIVTDGNTIASSCLAGRIRVWDPISGEPLAHIDRREFFAQHPMQNLENRAREETEPNNLTSSPESCLYRRSNGTGSEMNEGDYQIREMHSKSSKFPDLTQAINTKFSRMKKESRVGNYENGFDFGDQYKQIFEEHRKWVESEKFSERHSASPDVSPIWCMDYQENLIVVGCANGTLEFWEGTTGKYKYDTNDGSGVGISALKIVGNQVVVAKLNGFVDFFQLASYSEGQQMDWKYTAYRRTHVRTGSADSLMDLNNVAQPNEDLVCIKVGSHRAHQQAITLLDSEGGRVVTGSQDHTLKVYRLEDRVPLYTLHGHCGPISCLFIDRASPMTSGSGSQDGLLCIWDLVTGACMYSIQAHDGAVAAITCSASYVISIGADEKLCVWERFQGHLLHALPAHRSAYSLQLAMLTHHLLITSNQGSLVVWDVQSGEPIREVRLAHDSCVFVKQMIVLRDSIVCDLGKQLRIVRFPLVSQKVD